MKPVVHFAFRSRALAPEPESGDLHVVQPFANGTLLAVIDGLGHGSEAAAASRSAARVLSAWPDAAPGDLLTRCHDTLRGSRGAAMLVVSLSFSEESVRWAGVGNVEGWHLRSQSNGEIKREALLSTAGVVGYQLGRVKERQGHLSPGDTFVLVSDGIASGFMEELWRAADPDDLAADILDQHGRTTDDALVLVARFQEVSS